MDNFFLTKRKLVGHSDPSTDSFVWVWGAPFRPTEGKRRGGHTWWLLGAGKGPGEDVTDGAGVRPAVAARKGRQEREKGRGRPTDRPDSATYPPISDVQFRSNDS